MRKSIAQSWCFHLTALYLGWCSSSSKKFYFGLIWPKLPSKCLLWLIQMVYGKLQGPWTRAYAGLSRGTICCAGFSPIMTLLLMKTVETVVTSLFMSFTRSSHVVLGWTLTFDPNLRENNSHLDFLPFSINYTNNCCLLTMLFASYSVAHPSLVEI